MKYYGFSLIELLVVVSIIGILASVGIVSYNSYMWSAKKTSAKNIMQQMSLAQTEYISNSGTYFESTGSGSCDTSATTTQSEEINVRLLESKTIEAGKLGFNMCVIDVTGDPTLGYDYTIIAVATSRTCTFEFHSNGSWEDDTGEDC